MLMDRERILGFTVINLHLQMNRFWISDEYAPGIYRISPNAEVVQSLPIPDAITPLDKNGNLFFTSEEDPKTGRAGNQGEPYNGVSFPAILIDLVMRFRGPYDRPKNRENIRNVAICHHSRWWR